jgi:S1-C subfamily serine protease
MVTSSNETAGALLGLSNDLAGAVERAGSSTVAVSARQHVPSSGVHWRPGVIVTADHTIERDEGISVTLPDGRTAQATVAGRDAGTDLAVLKLEGADLPPADVGDAATLKVGNVVLAVARPGDVGLSASFGTISAIGGGWRTWSGGQIDRLVRPDLTLYPGFSGGPLVDAAGRIVGINTSGLSRSMTLTIPAATVNRVTDQLLATGRISRGYLGLGMQPVRLPPNLKSALNLTSETGLIVVSIEQGGPADRSGVIVGDVVVALDGKSVSDPRDVQNVLGSDSVGKQIGAQVIRGGEPKELTLTVGERPRRGE